MKAGLLAGAGMALPWRFIPAAQAQAFIPGLSDPAAQPKFVELAPNALDPGFLFRDLNENGGPVQKPNFSLRLKEAVQETGLINPKNGKKLQTRIWGYGKETISWPGQTIQVMNPSLGGNAETVVRWANELQGKKHLLPVDTSLHWCYALSGMSSRNGIDYRQFSIAKDGVPIITHLHGGNSDFQFDGNPEFFYSPDGRVKGPQWDFVEGGFTNTFRYNNEVPAGNLWYHDHALGLTRLNVYAGLAGFYFIRDDMDTGMPGNPLGLPAFPYELAYAVQDRMFTDQGALFYPAFPGDPFYGEFITEQGVNLPEDLFPGGGPTALAEFFGDHMVVNGKIWPKENVEPRNYRLRLLNGTDSRFMVVRFRVAAAPTATTLEGASGPLPFYVIGSDQGLAAAATPTDTLVFEPGSRYDIVFDFSTVPAGSRVIMENIGGDAPFGGDYGDALEPEDFFPGRQTDRIMAFDVVKPLNAGVPDEFDPLAISHYGGNGNTVDRTRKVALFEGMDEFGRLQPLLGTAEPATDYLGNPVYHTMGPLKGLQINGSVAWHEPTTENPALNSTEIWEIYNATGDAHPVHLHLVNFQVLDRYEYTADVIDQPVVQHNGDIGVGFRLENIQIGELAVDPGQGYVENCPKDMVTALPGQVTRIKATFDKPGRYVWHCHILSHEDHEMMRVLHVGPGA
ncbi:multicopper oxidase family protein [Desulfosarcina cetonica]|uniref:multicopper oxidase family protein n=1 Tax=Desulfosarcina cetonica TaxID=90730 RepID=UPI0006D29C00|nr:multicopper oxidase domain-containing protein [Desulfosarcina cetonica]